MLLPDDDYIRAIIHEADYDPEKRREYYLRTRELKGRRSGAIPSGGVRTAVEPRPNWTTRPTKPSVKPAVQPRPKSKTAEIEARVEALKTRLAKLREVLRELVRQAQIRAGVDPDEAKQPGSKQPTKKPATNPEKLTPEQQAAKEKADKEYYEKNKDKILEEQVKDLDEKIKAIQVKIKQMREQASKPVKKPVKTAAFKKAGSVGAASTKR